MNAAVEDAARRYFDRLMELRPVEASFFGLHQHDGRLPEGGIAELEEEISLTERFAAEAEAAAPGLERELALYFTRLTLFHARELRVWARMAEAPDQLGTAIFLLFARDFAPLEDRLDTIAQRLEAAPGYLLRSRERLREPVDLWNRIALESASGLPGMIDVVVAAAPPGAVRRRLERAGGTAKQALTDFAAWLEKEVLPGAGSEYAVGEARFAELLRLRRLPSSPEQILELGHSYLREVEENRRALVAEHWPRKTIDEVERGIRSDHPPDFPAALEEYRASIAQARRFVLEKGLASLPSGEVLEVVETPEFLRPVIPFAAYEPAAYFDERQLGIYLVTPPGDPGQLSESNRAGILNTSVHEGYPGHHLQFVCANRNPSILRLLTAFHATEFIEGWAHYCEELMYESGFGARPEVRFVQLTDLIWRACRIIIDVELSCGRMSFAEAVTMLVERAGMVREKAEAEVKRYTYTPGYQLSYLYGKHLLLELRRRIRERSGGDFALRAFHDRLLYGGALPAALWEQLF